MRYVRSTLFDQTGSLMRYVCGPLGGGRLTVKTFVLLRVSFKDAVLAKYHLYGRRHKIDRIAC